MASAYLQQIQAVIDAARLRQLPPASAFQPAAAAAAAAPVAAVASAAAPLLLQATPVVPEPISVANPFRFVPLAVAPPRASTAEAAAAFQADYSRLRFEAASAKANAEAAKAAAAREEAARSAREAARIDEAARNVLKRAAKTSAVDVEAEHDAAARAAEEDDEDRDANDAPTPLAMGSVKPRASRIEKLVSSWSAAPKSTKKKAIVSAMRAKLPTQSRWVSRQQIEDAPKAEASAALRLQKAKQTAMMREGNKLLEAVAVVGANARASLNQPAASASSRQVLAPAAQAARLFGVTTPARPAALEAIKFNNDSREPSHTRIAPRSSAAAAAASSTSAAARPASSSSASLSPASRLSATARPSDAVPRRLIAPPSKPQRNAPSSSESDSDSDSDSDRGASSSARAVLRAAKKRRSSGVSESAPASKRMAMTDTKASSAKKPVRADRSVSPMRKAAAAAVPLGPSAAAATAAAASFRASAVSSAAAAADSSVSIVTLPVIPLPTGLACAIATPLRQSFVDALLQLCLKHHPDRFDAQQLHPSLPANALLLRCEWEILEQTLRRMAGTAISPAAAAASSARSAPAKPVDVLVAAYRQATARALQLMRSRKDVLHVAKMVSASEDLSKLPIE